MISGVSHSTLADFKSPTKKITALLARGSTKVGANSQRWHEKTSQRETRQRESCAA